MRGECEREEKGGEGGSRRPKVKLEVDEAKEQDCPADAPGKKSLKCLAGRIVDGAECHKPNCYAKVHVHVWSLCTLHCLAAPFNGWTFAAHLTRLNSCCGYEEAAADEDTISIWGEGTSATNQAHLHFPKA